MTNVKCTFYYEIVVKQKPKETNCNRGKRL